ncbi:MAG: hypothetical protein K2O59_07105 [Lachnospiraceae bacterium]|nr:hypothetical protein [Lachnospiraceae bacterium]
MKVTKVKETRADEGNLSQNGVQRSYKDTVFRMIFREKKNLLSLYNALNGTAYQNVEDLEITTLENAVYMNYKNDISFVFDFELLLYEHQSTCNPNMPLRDLLYVTRVLQNLIKDENLYSKSLIRIPTPRFVVFYNGTDLQPEQQILYLSNAFEKKQDEPSLELAVTVYNINLGHNHELLDACRLLKEYAQYVEQVRIFARKMPFSEAVEEAVDYCISNGILADFLAKNRAEAIAVSIFEYDEEKHIKSERKEWREIGRKEGSDNLAKLLQSLIDAGKTEEANRAISDSEYREKLLKE